MMSALDVPLREELLKLRKKVVQLETADSDNSKLRKEMARLKMKMQEEKSKSELDFMNQLSEVIRGNALKMQEITGQLHESNSKNSALREQLVSKDPSPGRRGEGYQELAHEHNNEVSRIMIESNPYLSEVGRMSRQLHDAEKPREELIEKLEESPKSLNSLKHSANIFVNPILKKHSEVSLPCQTQKVKENTLFEDENQVLRSTIVLPQKENNEMRIALDNNDSKKCSSYDGCEKNSDISEPEKEILALGDSAAQMQNESRDLKDSVRNETSIEQAREFGMLSSQSHTFSQRRQSACGKVEIHENNTSRIIQQLEKSLKNNGRKGKISCRQIEMQTTDGKLRGIQIASLESKVKTLDLKSEMERKDSYEPEFDCEKSMESHKFQTSKLEDELLSMKKRLTRENEVSRKQIVDLNSKLTALQEILSNSESSRAALALDKERLIAETNRIAKSKIQLEQKAKHQHQRLKQLQKAVDEKLNRVEINHKSDEIQLQCVRGHAESLKREILRSHEHVRQLSKTLEEKEKTESDVEDLARKTIQSLRAEVNKLQEELTIKQMVLSEVDRMHKKEINELKPIIVSMHLELSENQKAGDVEIQKLKDLYEEKDTVSQRLEKEKEQLVLSMQDMMKNRRDEVDDLQNEILEMNTRLANETREISTLRSRLEESDHQTKEMIRLQETAIALSRKLVLKKNTEHENSALEKENRELRRKLEDISAQRLMVEEKLQNHASDRGSGGSSKSVQARRERNVALKFEVEKLTRKIEKMSEKLSENSIVVGIEPYAVGNDATRMAI